MRKKDLQAEMVSDNFRHPEISSALVEVMKARQFRQEGTAEMMKRLEGKVAVATGGNSCIGLATPGLIFDLENRRVTMTSLQSSVAPRTCRSNDQFRGIRDGQNI
jgi:hypothetical protein